MTQLRVYDQALRSTPTWRRSGLLLYDQRLEKHLGPSFIRLRKNFAASLGLPAGEGLKDLAAFPARLEKILKRLPVASPRELRIVSAGGGSVGDFAGFVASVLKRGVAFEQIPTTWLSAIDSAHGGKTALNVGRFKNQIGTFYPAEAVHLCWPWLEAQPSERAVEALGELVKMALIDGGPWARALAKTENAQAAFLLKKFLRPAIAAKLAVVRRDPHERTGLRRVLNFGHSLGHVLEPALKIPHGLAVSGGLRFALEWSRARGLLRPSADVENLEKLLPPLKVRPVARFRELLAQDKKMQGERLNFVFLSRLGKPLVLPVSLREMEAEARRQGWLR